jgi:hypothetical protein
MPNETKKVSRIAPKVILTISFFIAFTKIPLKCLGFYQFANFPVKRIDQSKTKKCRE